MDAGLAIGPTARAVCAAVAATASRSVAVESVASEAELIRLVDAADGTGLGVVVRDAGLAAGAAVGTVGAVVAAAGGTRGVGAGSAASEDDLFGLVALGAATAALGAVVMAGRRATGATLRAGAVAAAVVLTAAGLGAVSVPARRADVGRGAGAEVSTRAA